MHRSTLERRRRNFFRARVAAAGSDFVVPIPCAHSDKIPRIVNMRFPPLPRCHESLSGGVQPCCGIGLARRLLAARRPWRDNDAARAARCSFTLPIPNRRMPIMPHSASPSFPRDSTLAAILDTAVEIARSAGEILREGAERIRDRSAAAPNFKTTDIDPVTEYDLRSEQLIVARLREAFPSHRIIGEEGGCYREDSTVDASRVWQIDPLDGTVNFAHGWPLYCVSMGLLIGGVPSAGVIFNPATDEMFAAARDCGATCNGRPMRVSAIPELRRALLITGFSYDTHESDSNIRNFLGFQRTAQATRRIGSCALNLCYTAAGQMDGYWELKTKAHDIAAGIVLVREAGGIVTDFDGGESMLGSGRIVASNGLIHRQMLEVLQDADDRG